jgi:hypothetical protein
MTPINEIIHRSPKKIEFKWTSDANGTASEVTEGFFSGVIKTIKVTHDVVSPPAAAYDIVISDDDGDDLGCGMLKDIAPVETKVFSGTQCTLGSLAESRISFLVTGAGGAGKKGTITVFLR